MSDSGKYLLCKPPVTHLCPRLSHEAHAGLMETSLPVFHSGSSTSCVYQEPLPWKHTIMFERVSYEA